MWLTQAPYLGFSTVYTASGLIFRELFHVEVTVDNQCTRSVIYTDNPNYGTYKSVHIQLGKHFAVK